MIQSIENRLSCGSKAEQSLFFQSLKKGLGVNEYSTYVGEIQLYIVSWNNRIPLVFRNFQKCVAEINLQSVPLLFVL